MAVCSRCRHQLLRKHRTWIQRVFYTDVFQCTQCHNDVKWPRVLASPVLMFVFSRHTRCACCGNGNVKRLKRRDRVSHFSHHAISVLCRITGAPAFLCQRCWNQYYDWRSLRPSSTAALAENGLKTQPDLGSARIEPAESH
jgi:hypothetical protein